MKRPTRLSKTFVERVVQEGRYGDGRGGHGLSLMVKRRSNRTLSKTWSQRVRVSGKRTNLGLGSYPVVDLVMAREEAIENLRRIALGEDIRSGPAPKVLAGEFLKEEADARARRRSGKNAATESYRMMGFCTSIASKPVSDVTGDHVLAIIEPLWLKKMYQTARDVRSFLSAAMWRAIFRKQRTTDPAEVGILRFLGTADPPVHHRSLRYTLVGAALALIRDADDWWATRYALIFLCLTCVRSGDVRNARWAHVDLESDVPVWHIPKTKTRVAHDVPLSTQAVELLLYAEELTGGSGLVFPQQYQRLALNARHLSALMNDLGIDASPHGFRSSFRNWAGRRVEVAPAVAEAAIEHKASGVEGAYLTDDFFDERIPVTQAWSDYLRETWGAVISGRDLTVGLVPLGCARPRRRPPAA